MLDGMLAQSSPLAEANGVAPRAWKSRARAGSVWRMRSGITIGSSVARVGWREGGKREKRLRERAKFCGLWGNL